ncbi:PadR family transcriptional regulator [Cellulomonas sp. HZM]|uniref:PadR family transcriptional regulator n=1 Tax=Cellulomonas sp. HZM TaxID=1454010 RepID=UPI0004930674|nr:PadR family transcriptional regulator [Cellulomonas sp. HZM]
MLPGQAQVLANLRRGVVEYCVLASLRSGERYGFDIARELEGTLLASAGTLYPLLARLRKGGLVETSWRESTEGPPRRYYGLTPEGVSALAEFEAAWVPFHHAVNTALSEGKS